MANSLEVVHLVRRGDVYDCTACSTADPVHMNMAITSGCAVDATPTCLTCISRVWFASERWFRWNMNVAFRSCLAYKKPRVV